MRLAYSEKYFYIYNLVLHPNAFQVSLPAFRYTYRYSPSIYTTDCSSAAYPDTVSLFLRFTMSPFMQKRRLCQRRKCLMKTVDHPDPHHIYSALFGKYGSRPKCAPCASSTISGHPLHDNLCNLFDVRHHTIICR